MDEDGDGVTIAEGDCNDQMPNVSPLLGKYGMTALTVIVLETTILTKIKMVSVQQSTKAK